MKVAIQGKPLLHMIPETLRFTWTLYCGSNFDGTFVPPWISPEARKLCAAARSLYLIDYQRSNVTPSHICNGLAWWSILESLPNNSRRILVRDEHRYPYLDKDLVEYLFRIPREQVVRPGHRRSLMRRAVKEIVPGYILDRRRKAYLVRTPLVLMRSRKRAIAGLLDNSLLHELGLIDGRSIQHSFEKIVDGSEPKWWMGIMKAGLLELWLRNNRWISLSSTTDYASREIGELKDPYRPSESYLS